MENQKNKNKDIKMLKFMELKIDSYLNKPVDISDLIYGFKAYFDELTTVNEQWKEDFIGLWLDIEIAYSLALDQGLDDLTEEENVLTQQSLHVLKKMITSLIEEYLKTDDPIIQDTATIAYASWLLCPLCYEAWESSSHDPMVLCPTCESPLHNPFTLKQEP